MFRYGQLQNIMKMGPIGKVMQMIPGMGNMMPQVNCCCNAAAFHDQKHAKKFFFPQVTRRRALRPVLRSGSRAS